MMHHFTTPFIRELLICESNSFKPEEMKKLDSLENNLELLIKRNGKDTDRAWELIRKIVWTYITASAELIKTSHTPESKYFFSKGVQLLDPQTGTKNSNKEEIDFLRFCLTVNIACYNIARRDTIASKKSLLQIIEQKPNIRKDFISSYCLEFTEFVLAVIAYEQNYYDAAERHFRTFMLQLNGCQSYIINKNHKKRANHYLAKCYTYYFLGKIAMSQNLSKTFKYIEKAYTMSLKIDGVNDLIKQSMEQDYKKAKLRADEEGNDTVISSNNISRDASRRIITVSRVASEDNIQLKKTSKSKFQKLKKDGQLNLDVSDVKKRSLFQQASAENTMSPLRKSLLSATFAIKDSYFSEDYKELSIDAKGVDIMENLESPLQTTHRKTLFNKEKIKEQDHEESDVEGDFEDLFSGQIDSRIQNYDVKNTSVSFLSINKNDSQERKKKDFRIHMRKSSQGQTIDPGNSSATSRKSSISILSNHVLESGRSKTSKNNSRLIFTQQKISEIRRIENEAAKCIQQAWARHKIEKTKNHYSRPKKIRASTLIPLDLCEDASLDGTKRSNGRKTLSSLNEDHKFLAEREANENLETGNIFDYQLKPIPRLFKRLDENEMELKHPPVTPITPGVSSFPFPSSNELLVDKSQSLFAKISKIKSKQSDNFQNLSESFHIEDRQTPHLTAGLYNSDANVTDKPLHTDELASALQTHFVNNLKVSDQPTKNFGEETINSEINFAQNVRDTHLEHPEPLNHPKTLKIKLSSLSTQVSDPKAKDYLKTPEVGTLRSAGFGIKTTNALGTDKLGQVAETNALPASLISVSVASSLSYLDVKEGKPNNNYGIVVKPRTNLKGSSNDSISVSDISSVTGNKVESILIDHSSNNLQVPSQISGKNKSILRSGQAQRPNIPKKTLKHSSTVTYVRRNNVLRGGASQPTEKDPNFEVQEEIKLNLTPFKFYKAHFNKLYQWNAKFTSQIKDKTHQSSFYRFEVGFKPNVNLQFQVPAPDENQTFEESVTIWPRILAGFTTWFVKEKFEDIYRHYDHKTDAFVKEQIANPMHRNFFMVSHKGRKDKLTDTDVSSILQLKRRICFIIDKRLLIHKHENGTVLHFAKTVKDLLQREFLQEDTEVIENFYKNSREKHLGIKSKKREDDLSPVHSNHSKSSADRVQSETQRKLLIQSVMYHKHWYLIQLFVEDGNKLYLSNKDILGISINPLQTIKSIFSREFTFPVKTFIENIKSYLPSSYRSFYFTKQLPHSAVIQFIQNLPNIVLFKKDDVNISTDYVKEEADNLDFSFTESKNLNIHEFFQDSIRPSKKKRKNVTKNETDNLFEKNYNEVNDKYFSNKENLVFGTNPEDDPENQFGKIKVEEEDEAHAFKASQNEETLTPHGEHKMKRALEPSDSFASFSDRILQLKPKHYFKLEINNFSSMYLRIEIKKSPYSPFTYFDTNFMRLSGYHPLKRQIYYKEIYSQKIMDRITDILFDKHTKESKMLNLSRLIQNDLSLVGRSFYPQAINYDIQFIQKKNQFSLHPTFLKIALLKNSPCLLNAFKRYQFYFLHDIQAFGRTYVEMNVYHWNLSTPSEHQIHFSFDIHPTNTKTKQFKLILNDSDVQNFFGLSIKHEFTSHYIITLARTILSNFTFHRHYISKRLKVVSRHTFHKELDNKNYIFQNDLNPNNFDNNLKQNHFLEPRYYEPKIIFQQVKPYQNAFLIFTIQYIQPFDFWNIRIYNPKTSRTFTATINLRNIINWSLSYSMKVYPQLMDNINLENITDYQNYCDFYKRITTARKAPLTLGKKTKPKQQLFNFASLNKLGDNATTDQQLLLDHIDRVNSAFFLNHDAVQENGCKSKDPPQLLPRRSSTMSLSSAQQRLINTDRKLISNEIIKDIDYHEIKFWENVIMTCEFSNESRLAPALKINNFKSELKEMLYSEPIKVDKYTDTLIQIFHEKSDSSLDLFGTFNSISYLSSINYSLIIQIYYFKNMNIQIESMNLREMINLFIADGFYKYQANYFESKVNLADLKIICDYIIFKIKNANLVNLMHETPLFSRKFLQNSSEENQKQENHSSYTENDTTKIYLWRDILTSMPLQIVTLWYKPQKKKITAKIYRNTDSSSVEIDLKGKKIKKEIPFIQHMLDKKLYKIAAKRVIAVYHSLFSQYIDKNKNY